SATQPLGSPELLDRARITSRLGEVNSGFLQLADGAEQLRKGLTEGAAKLRAAIWLEEKTGLTLTGQPAEPKAPKTDAALARTRSGETLATGLKQASAVLQWTQGSPMSLNLPALNEALRASRNKPGLGSAAAKSAKTERADSRKPPKPEDEKPQETL